MVACVAGGFVGVFSGRAAKTSGEVARGMRRKKLKTHFPLRRSFSRLRRLHFHRAPTKPLATEANHTAHCIKQLKISFRGYKHKNSHTCKTACDVKKIFASIPVSLLFAWDLKLKDIQKRLFFACLFVCVRFSLLDLDKMAYMFSQGNTHVEGNDICTSYENTC